MSYAIATKDIRGITWFLSREYSRYQFHRTRDPLSAHLWDDLPTLRSWVNRLPAHAIEQLAGKSLFVVSVTASVSEAVETLVLPEPRLEAE
jgi:hypothetical protein